MKYKNTKNIINGMKFGIVYKIFVMFLSFALRTCIIYTLGIEYIGLNSLFSSILSVLSLTELGFSSAIVYSMYKPIAEEDYTKLNAIMKYYRSVYRVVGISILALGMMLVPFLKYIIKADCPTDLNLYILYIGYLLNTCSSYFCMGYRSSILVAYQREDISSVINGCVMTIGYIYQIFTIIVFKNYYLYLINVILMTITGNVSRAIYTIKRYSMIKCEGKLSKKEKNNITTNVGAIFLIRVGNTVSLSFDNIVISSCIGITAVAIYGNYNYIMTSIVGFFTIFYNLITAGIGNSMVVKSIKDNYKSFNKYVFVSNWALTWACSCLLCLYQPFMELWTGKDSMLDISFVILLTSLFYILCSRKVVSSYKDAAGLWKKDAFRPLIGATINLILNIISVKYIGINGIVLSTIVSYVMVEIPWETWALFKFYFNTGKKEYYFLQVKNVIELSCILGLTYLFCNRIKISSLYVLITLRLIICCFVPNIIMILFHIKDERFKWVISILKKRNFI